MGRAGPGRGAWGRTKGANEEQEQERDTEGGQHEHGEGEDGGERAMYPPCAHQSIILFK